MKKFTKIILIISLVLVVIGNMMYWGAKLYKFFSDDYDTTVGSRAFEISEAFDSIDINAQYANVQILPGDTCTCTMDNVELDVSDVYVSDYTLHVVAKNKENMNIFGWNIGNIVDGGEPSKIILHVPIPYEKLVVSSSQLIENGMDTAGVVKIHGIKADIGSGRFDCSTLITDKLVIQLGAGELKCGYLAVADKGAIQMGIGRTGIEMLECEDVTVKNGIGAIDIGITGDLERYDIKVADSVGRVYIAGLTKTGLNIDTTKRGTGEKLLELETGAGTIRVRQ